MNRMILNETAWFGRGSLAALTDEVTRRGYQKALVVTDKILLECGVATRLISRLEQAGLDFAIFDAVKPNPTISIVQQGVDAFRQSEADYLIALGGGSPQDTCKAIGIIINNPEFADVRSLEGVADTRKPCVPILAIPTTAGTAAEVTINYVITDEERRRKFVCVDPHAIPAVAFIDADMMDSMPAALKAATGVDALTHAIEVISRSLRAAVKGDATASEDMALGQYIAGMGFSNVGLGLVHGMAHPLGAFYNMAHGVANAILLPYIMRYNAAYTGERFRQIAVAMGLDNALNLPLDQVREQTIQAVFALNRDIGIPASLSAVGMRADDIPALAVAAFADVCTGGNPREASVDEIMTLYHQAC